MLKNDMDWEISSQAPNRRRFNDYPFMGVGRNQSLLPKRSAPDFRVKI